MDDATQALLAGAPGIDRNDPAIQAALAVIRLEEPQAPRPSAEPPWLLKDLTETIASFLCPVDALALDASGSATRCVMVEVIGDDEWARVEFLGARDIYHAHRWFDVPLGRAPARLHTVAITFFWSDQGWGAHKGMLSVVRHGGRAPDDYAPWTADVMCGKEPAPHTNTHDSMEFRPRAGEGYAVWYRVGGGGGHRLFIHRMGMHRLHYR